MSSLVLPSEKNKTKQFIGDIQMHLNGFFLQQNDSQLPFQHFTENYQRNVKLGTNPLRLGYQEAAIHAQELWGTNIFTWFLPSKTRCSISWVNVGVHISCENVHFIKSFTHGRFDNACS
jgi:hypothetical protein